MGKLHVIFLGVLVILSGCVIEKDISQSDSTMPDTEPTAELEVTEEAIASGLKEIEVELTGVPIQIDSEKVGAQTEWSVVLEDGTIQQFRLNMKNGELEETTEEKNAAFFIKPAAKMNVQSKTNQPKGNLETTLLQTQENEFVYVESNGDLVFWNGEQEEQRMAINALPDSYLLLDDTNRLLVLTHPTSRYDHGIFGDQIEASGFAIIDIEKKSVIYRASVPKKDVIESLKPLWVDWDQNGTKEIVLTLSNDEDGARLVLFDETGKLLAEGESLGQSHRWRHALTVGAFHSKDKLELAEITTPHIGGNLQFVEWDQENNSLKVVASGSKYSTHSIGSKNLEMHTSIDFDFDGQLELWVPNQEKDELLAVQRTANGFETIEKFPLGGNLSSNIVSVSTEDWSAMAAGTESAVLKIWAFAK